MKCLIIYSPFALRGKIEKKLPKIVQILRQKYEVDLAKTLKANHATELAKDACGVYDIVAVAGGDGLVNEVLNGIANQQNQPKLALLPFGTVNDFARSFGIKKNVYDCANKAVNGLQHNLDFFEAHDGNRFFANYVICAGQHTESTYKTKQKSKIKLGWFAYFWQAIKSVFVPKKYSFNIELDNTMLSDTFCFVMFINSRSVAGFKLNKNANLTDGMFDVVLIKKSKCVLQAFAKYATFAKLFLFGAQSLKKHKNAVVRTVKQAKIVNDQPFEVNVDGECKLVNNSVLIGINKNKATWVF